MCKGILTRAMVITAFFVIMLSYSIIVVQAEAAGEVLSITWRFSVFEEPDFTAEVLGSFNPQQVVVFEQYGDWSLVILLTSLEVGWIFTSADKLYIDRIMGVYDAIGGNLIDRMNPQVISVIDRQGNWIKIDYWGSNRWINLDFTPPTQELDNLLRRFGNNLSVYFENLETGFVYRYNANRVYFSASVPKASFALYIYQKAERGETDLDSIHTFTRADYMGGSGVIRHRYRPGATFTQRELLRLNLSESDNIATLMLIRIHGLAGYRQFISDIGGTTSFVQNRVMNSNLTANEAGLFAREIFQYIESEGRYSEEFRAHLLDNQFPFIISDYPVASKTGWTRPIAWHDMAIVYAPSPYILVILSARDGWSERDYREFAEISLAFQRFNDMWFVRGDVGI